MKRFLGILLVLAILVASSLGVYAWITNPKSSFTVKMKESGGISLATSKTGEYTGYVQGESKEIGLCSSTDGISFIDEKGNASTEYAQYLFYLIGDKPYDTLYVENLKITPACDSLRVSVEYDSLCTIVPSGTKTSLKKSVKTSPTALKVRVWFDGESTKSYVSDDISVEIEFSAI